MNQLELNIKHSFTEVRKDIIEIKNNVLKIAERQEDLAKLVIKTNGHKPQTVTNTRTITKIKTVRPKTVKKTYIASKEGKKFHIKECPYAQNIKPKSTLKFKTKDSALNKGYKPCKCIK